MAGKKQILSLGTLKWHFLRSWEEFSCTIMQEENIVSSIYKKSLILHKMGKDPTFHLTLMRVRNIE